MPLRVGLNVAYAMLVQNMGGKERAEFDSSLHGWDAINERANRALWDQRESGGES